MFPCHRGHRALVGLAAAAVLSLPMVFTPNAFGAPAKKKPNPKKPAPSAKGDPKAGKGLFASEGCTACHKTGDYKDGGNTAPDLTTVGKDKKEAEILGQIMHPKAGSSMPATKDAKKAKDLTAYLLTQK